MACGAKGRWRARALAGAGQIGNRIALAAGRGGAGRGGAGRGGVGRGGVRRGGAGRLREVGPRFARGARWPVALAGASPLRLIKRFLVPAAIHG